MDVFPLDTSGRLEAAARLALLGHRTLRQAQPHLPAQSFEDILGALGWVANEGTLLGVGRPEDPTAFFGGFPVDDFRNAGPGVFCPDFAHGAAPETDPFEAYRHLYRELAGVWAGEGRRIHGVGLYATEDRALEAFSLLGFGRIVFDAAVATGALEGVLGTNQGSGGQVRRATSGNAAVLEGMGARLAAHIGASPVLMPRTRGESREGWVRWLGEPENLAFLWETPSGPTGYLRAGPPQWDVSRAVHGPSTLAVCGLWVEPSSRGTGAAAALVRALAAHARQAGKTLVSVDGETHNLEGYAFWTRRFRPLSWSLERRV